MVCTACFCRVVVWLIFGEDGFKCEADKRQVRARVQFFEIADVFVAAGDEALPLRNQISVPGVDSFA